MGNYLIYGDVNSADYGVVISGGGTFRKPARRIQKYSVPGRNGDLTITEDAFDNVEITYQAFIARGFEHKFHEFMEAMSAQDGYQKLTDTYDPSHYRMGIFAGEMEPETGTLNRTGKFTLVFDCQPQRWFKDSQDFQTVWTTGQTNATMFNPTKYNAKPIIRVYGYGTFVFDGSEITISSYSGDGYVDIDCDLGYCKVYPTGLSFNDHVAIEPSEYNGRTYRFPIIHPGLNSINTDLHPTDFHITRIDIKERYWTI